jgi:hypothetical protein
MPEPKVKGASIWRGPVRHQQTATGKMTCVWWVFCPKCERTGMADRDQIEGRVSLICDNCGWHGYMAKPLTPGQVEEALGSVVRGRRRLKRSLHNE